MHRCGGGGEGLCGREIGKRDTKQFKWSRFSHLVVIAAFSFDIFLSSQVRAAEERNDSYQLVRTLAKNTAT